MMPPLGKTAPQLGAVLLLCSASFSSFGQSPVSCQELDGAQVFSDEATGYRYLGFFGTSDGAGPDSIMFTGGSFGDSANLEDSVRGNGRYGSATECVGTGILSSQCELEVLANGRPSPTHASNDPVATLPPLIVKDGQVLSRLTTNPTINPGTSLDWIDSNCAGSGAFASTTANGNALPSPVSISATDDRFSSDVSENGAVKVSWSIGNSSFAAATGIQVQVSDNVSGPRTTIEAANIKDLDVVGSNGSAVIVGLVPERDYIVWAALTNASGTAQLTGSDPGTAQSVAASRPDPVTGIVATPGPERLLFSFDPPSETGGKPIVRYEYYLVEGADNRICPRTLAQQQSAGNTTSVPNPPVLIEGLPGDTTYTFCVSACNVDECSRVSISELITATTGSPASPPDAPSIDRIEFEDGVILIFFTPGSDNGEVITRFDARCGESLLGSGTSSPLRLPGAEEGETYDCSVSASNDAGTGSGSQAVSLSADVVSSGLFLPILIEALKRTE